MIFENDKVSVRLLELSDKYLLAKWLSNPLVLEFHEGRDNPFDLEKVSKKFYHSEQGVTRCIIKYEDVEIGYIQYYKLDMETRIKYGYINLCEVVYGTDQFIGDPEYWNKGIGKMFVKSMTAYLLEQKNASRVVMDPQTKNVRELSCYEKCGFKKVKLLPQNEMHEGELRDCWLIEYTKNASAFEGSPYL